MKVLKDLAVSGQITVGQLLQSSIDTDKFLVSDGGVVKFRTGSQLLGDIDGVINTRTITINGTAQDLTANRSWTVGDVRTDSSYANPAWITSLAWSKITGAPAFLTAESDTLATVTGRGASTSTTLSLAKVITTGLYGPGGTGNIAIWQYDSANTGYGLVYVEGTPSDALRIDVSGNALTGTPDFQISPDAAYINGALVATQSWVTSQGYITSVSDVWVNNSGDSMTGNLSFGSSGAGITWAANTDGASITFESTGDGASGGRALSNLLIALTDNGDEGLKVTTTGTELLYVNTNQFQYKGNNVWHAGNLTNLNQLTNGPGYITSYTETDTLASVTGRGNTTTNRIGVSTSSPINLAASGNAGTWIGGIQDATSGWSISNNGIGLKADDSTYAGMVLASGGGILYFGRTLSGGAGTMASWLEVNNSGIANFKLARPQHNGSNLALVSEIPTNLNQLTNGPGYITSSALNSYLPLSGGTMTGNVQFNANLLQFNNNGVRSWNMGISGGNLNVYSGDGSGSLLYNGRPLRDSYYRTYSGYSDYYGGGTGGWYRVAQITLTGNCSGSVLYGTLYDHRYDGADTYQIAVVARAECDFTSNNESHYINVGCTILGSTNYTDYRSKIRVVLTGSSSGSRTYELQFYESPWNHDTWQIETTGWTVYTSPQVANASTGTPRVNYISNHNADYIRANTAVYSPVYYDSSNTQYYLDGNVSGGWRVGTPTGYLDFGPLNADFCHFQTDRTKFYFNKRVEIDGELHRYGGSRFVENTGTWSISVTGSAGSLSNMNISQFNNNSGYITSTNTDFTYAATLTITTSWQNSGVSNSNLTSSGVYLVTVYANDAAVAGYQYSETHVGLMYWYASSTNGENYAEIPLHHMGHADNDRYFYLRTKTTTGGNGSFLQIRGNYTANGNSTYTFTFKRLM